MQPGDLISPNAELFEIPENEWTLTFNQIKALADFRATAAHCWTVRQFKGDSVPYWLVERGDGEPIIELALTRALRLALETE